MSKRKYVLKVVITETAIQIVAETTEEARAKAKTLLQKKFEDLVSLNVESVGVLWDVER